MEFLVFQIFHHGTLLSKQIAKDSRKHLENQVKDPILREKLWPRGQGWGCKRVLVSDKYYPTLQKANVELITDPPIRITATGIISKPTPLVTKDEMVAVEKELDSRKAVHNVKREVDLKLDTYIQDPNSRERNIDVDVLIWGTGFVIQDLGGSYKVIGQSGATLQQHWSEEVNSLYGMSTFNIINRQELRSTIFQIFSSFSVRIRLRCGVP
jgi:cation diffusion facilitator CzcD-associated flavoprotein CzcO